MVVLCRQARGRNSVEAEKGEEAGFGGDGSFRWSKRGQVGPRRKRSRKEGQVNKEVRESGT